MVATVVATAIGNLQRAPVTRWHTAPYVQRTRLNLARTARSKHNHHHQ